MEEAEPVVVGNDVDGAPEAAANAVVDSNNGHVFTNNAVDDVDDSLESNAAELLSGSDDGTAAAHDNGGAIVTHGDAAMANEHGHSYQQHHGHKWRSEHHKAHGHAHPPKARGSEQVSPPADGAVSEDGGSAAAVASGFCDDLTPAFEPNMEPSHGPEWVADFADFSAAPPAADAANVEWGSPVAFKADDYNFGEWGAAPFGTAHNSAQAVPPPPLPVAEEVKTADPLLAACLTGNGDVAALLQQLEFGAGPAAELPQYTQDPATAVEIEIDRAFAKEPEDTIQWSRSMMELLLYAQLGVAVPRYAPPPKKKKYFAAMERFTTKVMNDDCEVALDLKKTPAEHTLLDGLLTGVTSTAKVTMMPFSALGRGLGAAGSAIGSAASRITAFSGSDGDRPRSPERRSSLRGSRSSSSNSKKGADDDDKSIFATSLANLSPEELEALGLRFGGVVGADGENGIQDDSFLTPEARALAEQMRKMEAALLEEWAELARQDRILEIERREQEMFPEKVKDDTADIGLIDDAWSREMREQGLKHVSGDGDERRIFHEALPEEFDLNKFLSSTSPARNSLSAAQSRLELEPAGAETFVADTGKPNGCGAAADEVGPVVENRLPPPLPELAAVVDEAPSECPVKSTTEAPTRVGTEDVVMSRPISATRDDANDVDEASSGNAQGQPDEDNLHETSWA